MKLMKEFLLIFISIIFAYYTNAQENQCKVLKSEIAERYEGSCKSGLAHGKGVAVGVDKYSGKFKKGYPHGLGEYLYSTGEKYSGNFKAGMRDGKGTYYYTRNGVDSSFNGLWKNDTLVKKILPPRYKIEKNMSVIRYSVQKVNEGNRVLFTFLQNGVQNLSMSNLDLISTRGTETRVSSKQGFENIEFPVFLRVTYVTFNSLRTNSYLVEFEITINEPGDWLITLHN